MFTVPAQNSTGRVKKNISGCRKEASMILERPSAKRYYSVKLTLLIALFSMWFFELSPAQTNRIQVISDAGGSRLQVNGKDLMIFGMNWDYIPIGHNYSYSLWTQPDDVIREALDREMSLLKGMGINTIRHYNGIPPKWVTYIYENYGIYTAINHPLGRYGLTIDGSYVASTDYSDPKTREILLAEMRQLVDEFKHVPGMLMWIIGNENNYGLYWRSAETEALPEGERQAARARHLYSLFGEVVAMMKKADPDRPIAMANGDVQFIDIIAEEVKGLDIFGTNVYRGISARDLFDVVKEKLNIPVLFTEFGSDAFNARAMREDQAMQARYLIGQWEEIYEQSSFKGRAGNAIGGFTFQFSDGWWKYRQEENLSVHDINASWPNGGYAEDLVPGENNMNEEWWGICAKGHPDSRGLYQLYPRAAYFALQRAYQLDPYASSTTLEAIRAHFSAIRPAEVEQAARGDRAALLTETLSRVRVKGLRAQFETISTGGAHVSTPESALPSGGTYPAFRGFDHLQSYYTEFEAKPAENVTGSLALNYLGNVPENPIDEIFYENRGRAQTVITTTGNTKLEDIERIRVYRASLSWVGQTFDVTGFYRSGHYHWGYEGDFFGLYREANYGTNIDLYKGEAPSGFEITGKKSIAGLKLVLGPELWWGANPAFLVKYSRRFGSFLTTGIYQEDLQQQTSTTSSNAIPLPQTRKATLHMQTSYGRFNIEFGGIWSGENKAGQRFQIVDKTDTGYAVYIDRIRSSDAFGGKAKITYSKGRWNWYAQTAAMGLVADGGPTSVQTFAGWRLKDSGKGNQTNFLTGFTYLTGDFQIAPNFLYQKPIEGPIPGDVPPPGRPRNVLDDPFAVRENRETVAGELLITYDPTPASWMYSWDSDLREDASLAVSAGFVFRHLPTTQDVSIGIMADGYTTFAFDSATPPRDLWEAHARIVSSLRPGLRLIANLYTGTGEPNGADARKVKRFGADIRVVRNSVRLATTVRINDWGPYDYHRDFNLTFPLQLAADLSTSLGAPNWLDTPQTRLGVKAVWRSLDQYSPRYLPAGGISAPGQPKGNEWEIRTYLHLSVGM